MEGESPYDTSENPLSQRIRPVVQSCFSGLTLEQWERLWSGNPDEETQNAARESLAQMTRIPADVTGEKVSREKSAESFTKKDERERTADQKYDQSFHTAAMKSCEERRIKKDDQRSQLAPGSSTKHDKASTFSPAKVSKSVSAATPGKTHTKDKLVKKEKCIKLVKKLVEDLILLVFSKANVACSDEDSQAMNKRLFEKILTEAEKLNFDIPKKKFDNLEKLIYDDLCKQMLCPNIMSIIILGCEEPFIDQNVASSFKKHVTQEVFKKSWLGCKPRQKKPDICTHRRDVYKKPSDRFRSSAKRRIFREQDCRVLVHYTVQELFYKLRDVEQCQFYNTHAVMKRLFDQMMAEAKLVDYKVEATKFGKLHEVILQDFRRRLSCPCVIALLMKADRPVCDVIIMESFRKHLPEKRRPNCFDHFLNFLQDKWRRRKRAARIVFQVQPEPKLPNA